MVVVRLDAALLRHWHFLLFSAGLLLFLLVLYSTHDPTRQKATDAEEPPFYQQRLQQYTLTHEPSEITDLALQEAANVFPSLADAIKEWHKEQHTRKLPFQRKQADKAVIMGEPSADNACEGVALPISHLRNVVASALLGERVLPSEKSLLQVEERGHNQFCVRAILYPRLPSINPYRLLYEPLNGTWWDAVMVWAAHVDAHIQTAVPLKMEPWSGHQVLRDAWFSKTGDANQPQFAQMIDYKLHERETVHVYEATLTLPDPGTYYIRALWEYHDAEWNFEKGPVVPYKPQDLPAQKVQVRDKDVQNEAIIKEHLSLPLCTGADHPGRWLPAPAFREQDQADDVSITVDNNGKFWAPYTCRYRRIEHTEFTKCLRRQGATTLDIYGDSNMRRALKKLMTHDTWCQNWHTYTTDGDNTTEVPIQQDKLAWRYDHHPNQLRACYCEDYREPGWNTSWIDPDARFTTIHLDQDVRIQNYKWDGLTYLNDPDWSSAFTNTSIDWHVEENSAARRVVIVSLGNWDTAFMTLAEFGEQIDRLVRYLSERYTKNGVRFLYRTPQYYCCRVDTSPRKRRTSRTRLEAFDALARQKLAQLGRLSVWDTKIMGDSRTWEEKQASVKCPSNHVSADLVEIENQVLMNNLCNGGQRS